MRKNINIAYENNTLVFSADGFTPTFKTDADFWRLHLDYCENGKNNDLGVYSKHQNPASVVKEDGILTVLYNELVAEDGLTYPIKLVLTVEECQSGVSFAATITNNSKVRVNELQYPLIEVERFEDKLCNDILYMPLGLGTRIKNPYKKTQEAHTEYMAADYKNTWVTYTYPEKMTMPWYGIQSGKHFLYLARLDEIYRITNFVTGIGPREEKEDRFILSVSSYPAVLPNESLSLEGYRLELYDTDWREAADSYRAWANKTFLAPLLDENQRIVKKDSVKCLNGWQRIILKHQYGEIFHTYQELPRIYEEGAKYGIRMILLFAWWQEGMDNGYPNYQPADDLGGADELRKAIRKINDMGGKIVLYANGHLIDVSTDYYKEEGYKYTIKNIEMQEYREYYKFSNNGTMLRFGGYKTFVDGCFGAKPWHDKVIELSYRHRELGSNGTFFDQLSCRFLLCFDRSHSHGNRIDTEPQLRVNAVKDIRATVSEDDWFGSECVSDRISTLLDFTHGFGPGMFFSDGAYPYIYRYTLPEVMVSNRLAHDEKPGYQRELKYAFVYGLLFDVSLYRGRVGSMEDCPGYSALVGKLTALREEYRDFFVDGRFDIPSLELPDGIWGAEYSLNGEKILVVWNDTDALFTLEDYAPVESGEVAVLRL